MTDITNPQSVKFCNEQIRIAADRLAQAYYHASEVVDLWFAQGHNTTITDNALDTVIDGSTEDGRTVITGADVHAMTTLLAELVADYEANSNDKLNVINKVSVNSRR